ncbi:hypothetical protein [Phormidesmis priestleyi]
MADIIVVIRNGQGAGMSSIDGELVIVLLASEGSVLDQQPVMLRSAIAIFADLPFGEYTVLVRHRSLAPTEARQDIEIQSNVMVGVKFIYSESNRQLIRVEVREESLNV